MEQKEKKAAQKIYQKRSAFGNNKVPEAVKNPVYTKVEMYKSGVGIMLATKDGISAKMDILESILNDLSKDKSVYNILATYDILTELIISSAENKKISGDNSDDIFNKLSVLEEKAEKLLNSCVEFNGDKKPLLYSKIIGDVISDLDKIKSDVNSTLEYSGGLNVFIDNISKIRDMNGVLMYNLIKDVDLYKSKLCYEDIHLLEKTLDGILNNRKLNSKLLGIDLENRLSLEEAKSLINDLKYYIKPLKKSLDMFTGTLNVRHIMSFAAPYLHLLHKSLWYKDEVSAVGDFYALHNFNIMVAQLKDFHVILNKYTDIDKEVLDNLELDESLEEKIATELVVKYILRLADMILDCGNDRNKLKDIYDSMVELYLRALLEWYIESTNKNKSNYKIHDIIRISKIYDAYDRNKVDLPENEKMYTLTSIADPAKIKCNFDITEHAIDVPTIKKLISSSRFNPDSEYSITRLLYDTGYSQINDDIQKGYVSIFDILELVNHIINLHFINEVGGNIKTWVIDTPERVSKLVGVPLYKSDMYIMGNIDSMYTKPILNFKSISVVADHRVLYNTAKPTLTYSHFKISTTIEDTTAGKSLNLHSFEFDLVYGDKSVAIYDDKLNSNTLLQIRQTEIFNKLYEGFINISKEYGEVI